MIWEYKTINATQINYIFIQVYNSIVILYQVLQNITLQTQLTFTSSKSTIETLEQGVKYVHN